ncbi:hypothetical protein B566_EDAN016450, partial [Ephemera danica]
MSLMCVLLNINNLNTTISSSSWPKLVTQARQHETEIYRLRLRTLIDKIHLLDPYDVVATTPTTEIVDYRVTSGPTEIWLQKRIDTASVTPYSDPHLGVDKISYADIAAGRISPCSFSYVEEIEDTHKNEQIETTNSLILLQSKPESNELKIPVIGKKGLFDFAIEEPLTNFNTMITVEEFDDAGKPVTTNQESEARRSRPSHRREIFDLTQTVDQEMKFISATNPMEQTSQIMIPRSRGRSASPFWIPGVEQPSYAEILKGRHSLSASVECLPTSNKVVEHSSQEPSEQHVSRNKQENIKNELCPTEESKFVSSFNIDSSQNLSSNSFHLTTKETDPFVTIAAEPLNIVSSVKKENHEHPLEVELVGRQDETQVSKDKITVADSICSPDRSEIEFAVLQKTIYCTLPKSNTFKHESTFSAEGPVEKREIQFDSSEGNNTIAGHDIAQVESKLDLEEEIEVSSYPSYAQILTCGTLMNPQPTKLKSQSQFTFENEPQKNITETFECKQTSNTCDDTTLAGTSVVDLTSSTPYTSATKKRTKKKKRAVEKQMTPFFESTIAQKSQAETCNSPTDDQNIQTSSTSNIEKQTKIKTIELGVSDTSQKELHSDIKKKRMRRKKPVSEKVRKEDSSSIPGTDNKNEFPRLDATDTDHGLSELNVAHADTQSHLRSTEKDVHRPVHSESKNLKVKRKNANALPQKQEKTKAASDSVDFEPIVKESNVLTNTTQDLSVSTSISTEKVENKNNSKDVKHGQELPPRKMTRRDTKRKSSYTKKEPAFKDSSETLRELSPWTLQEPAEVTDNLKPERCEILPAIESPSNEEELESPPLQEIISAKSPPTVQKLDTHSCKDETNLLKDPRILEESSFIPHEDPTEQSKKSLKKRKNKKSKKNNEVADISNVSDVHDKSKILYTMQELNVFSTVTRDDDLQIPTRFIEQSECSKSLEDDLHYQNVAKEIVGHGSDFRNLSFAQEVYDSSINQQVLHCENDICSKSKIMTSTQSDCTNLQVTIEQTFELKPSDIEHMLPSMNIIPIMDENLTAFNGNQCQSTPVFQSESHGVPQMSEDFITNLTKAWDSKNLDYNLSINYDHDQKFPVELSPILAQKSNLSRVCDSDCTTDYEHPTAINSVMGLHTVTMKNEESDSHDFKDPLEVSVADSLKDCREEIDAISYDSGQEMHSVASTSGGMELSFACYQDQIATFEETLKLGEEKNPDTKVNSSFEINTDSSMDISDKQQHPNNANVQLPSNGALQNPIQMHNDEFSHIHSPKNQVLQEMNMYLVDAVHKNEETCHVTLADNSETYPNATENLELNIKPISSAVVAKTNLLSFDKKLTEKIDLKHIPPFRFGENVKNTESSESMVLDLPAEVRTSEEEIKLECTFHQAQFLYSDFTPQIQYNNAVINQCEELLGHQNSKFKHVEGYYFKKEVDDLEGRQTIVQPKEKMIECNTMTSDSPTCHSYSKQHAVEKFPEDFGSFFIDTYKIRRAEERYAELFSNTCNKTEEIESKPIDPIKTAVKFVHTDIVENMICQQDSQLDSNILSAENQKIPPENREKLETQGTVEVPQHKEPANLSTPNSVANSKFKHVEGYYFKKEVDDLEGRQTIVKPKEQMMECNTMPSDSPTCHSYSKQHAVEEFPEDFGSFLIDTYKIRTAEESYAELFSNTCNKTEEMESKPIDPIKSAVKFVHTDIVENMNCQHDSQPDSNILSAENQKIPPENREKLEIQGTVEVPQHKEPANLPTPNSVANILKTEEIEKMCNNVDIYLDLDTALLSLHRNCLCYDFTSLEEAEKKYNENLSKEDYPTNVDDEACVGGIKGKKIVYDSETIPQLEIEGSNDGKIIFEVNKQSESGEIKNIEREIENAPEKHSKFETAVFWKGNCPDEEDKTQCRSPSYASIVNTKQMHVVSEQIETVQNATSNVTKLPAIIVSFDTNETSDWPEIETDSEGFVEYVSKKEKRRRRHRSTSASFCDDDSSEAHNESNQGNAVIENLICESDNRIENMPHKPPHLCGFWINKFHFDDAEKNWQEIMAMQRKRIHVVVENGKRDTESPPRDGDLDKRYPSDENTDQKDTHGSNLTNMNYVSADLPRGLACWNDTSTYITNEQQAKYLIPNMNENNEIQAHVAVQIGCNAFQAMEPQHQKLEEHCQQQHK